MGSLRSSLILKSILVGVVIAAAILIAQLPVVWNLNPDMPRTIADVEELAFVGALWLVLMGAWIFVVAAIFHARAEWRIIGPLKSTLEGLDPEIAQIAALVSFLAVFSHIVLPIRFAVPGIVVFTQFALLTRMYDLGRNSYRKQYFLANEFVVLAIAGAYVATVLIGAKLGMKILIFDFWQHTRDLERAAGVAVAAIATFPMALATGFVCDPRNEK